MELPSLSEEQARAIGEQVRVIEAGPGSGKTRALVRRFMESASETDRGVALLSFTNAAVDEVRERCGGNAHMLQAPHFLGTIDRFLHRFVVSPAVSAELRRMPEYWASWDDLPGETKRVRVGSVPGVGVRLSQFRMRMDGTIELQEQGLSWEERAYLSKVSEADKVDEVVHRASGWIGSYLRGGVYDANAARVKAYESLQGEDGPAILQRLARRFSEVLVDEAQDCDEPEIEILKQLASEGVTTLVVADPDQAIFEFRGSDPQLFLDYRDSHDEDAIEDLSTNWRSTQSICEAVTSLRCAGNAAITPSNVDACCPVYVLAGDVEDQRTKFLALLNEHDIALADAIVLGHRRNDAQAVSGRPSLASGSRALGNQLAEACSRLQRPSADVKDRREAIKSVERIVMELVAWPVNLADAGIDTQLAALDRSRGWLRQTAAALVAGLSTIDQQDSFGPKARSLTAARLEGIPFGSKTLGHVLRRPDDAVWAAARQAVGGGHEQALDFDTIHGAKGMEFPAVLVALPTQLRKVDERTVLEDWAGGVNSEPRRVLYVGASRAESLLAYGAGAHSDSVLQVLSDDGVSVERR